jgi:RNA polymerase sigma-70 factor (ECF subfamily)
MAARKQAAQKASAKQPTMVPGDDELLRRMKSGDEEAFACLYGRHQRTVYRFALQMSGRASVAEEVTQEVFLALIREPQRYDPARARFSTYLYGMARNQVLRHLERERAGDESEFTQEPAAGDDVLADLTRRENLDSLRRAILALPETYREVVVLCELHEMSYAQVAEVLGCAVGTVRSRLHRGRAMLLERFRGLQQNPEKARRCCV